MSNMLKKLEKAFYITLFILGMFFIISGFIGSSILNMIARISIGGLIAIGIVPEISAKIDKKAEFHTLKAIQLFNRNLARINVIILKIWSMCMKPFRREVSSEADITNS